ncbi:MAG: gamma carbonic anhydrase family protein [Clostridia bacterium]|nr:gamma carbonic anhydrase family protein [Clostridia bacterium]
MILEVEGMKPKISTSSYTADALIAGDVEIGENVNIWFNTVVRGDVNVIRIGKNSNIQDNCTLHTSVEYPVIVGENTVVGHNAVVHACTIGDNVLVGIGAIVLDGAIIGSNVVIGAHTLIPPGKVIPDNSVVMGNPYKIVRDFSEKDEEMIQSIINRYIKWSKVYKETAKEVNQ